MDNQQKSILNSTGVFRYYCGYDYFVLAVDMARENPSRLRCIRKEIYYPVAVRYQTSVENVERCLRIVRDVFMRNGGSQELTKLTGCRFWEHRTPYPRELIEAFALNSKETS